MRMRSTLVAAMTAALAMPATGLAEPFLPSDPRALAMGGASTAAADGPNAVLYNSALASPAMRRYSSGLSIFAVGASVADRDDFIEALEDFDDSNIIDRIEVDIRAFNDTFDMIRTRIDNDEYNTVDELEADLAVISDDLSAVDMTSRELKDLVVAMADKPVTFDLRGSGAFGTRIGGWGTGLHYQARGYGGGLFHLADQDLALVDNTFDVAGEIVACLEDAAEGGQVDEARLQECRDLSLPDERTADNFSSDFRFQGAVLSEFGLTFARDFSIGNSSLAVGITPKQVEVSTYDYIVRVQDESQVDFADTEETHSNVNLDLGFALAIREDLRLGATIRNAFSQSYGTVEGNEIELKPQVRVGVSWDRRLFTLAADLDLTENQPMGFGPETRFLALGGEFSPLSWFHLRAGYRMNLASSDLINDVGSVGFGLSPGPLRFDVGVAGNDNEVAGYLQLGLTFGG